MLLLSRPIYWLLSGADVDRTTPQQDGPHHTAIMGIHLRGRLAVVDYLACELIPDLHRYAVGTAAAVILRVDGCERKGVTTRPVDRAGASERSSEARYGEPIEAG